MMATRRPVRRARALVVFAGLAVIAAVLAACTTTVSGMGTTTELPGAGASNEPTQPAASFYDCSQAFNLGALNFPAGRLAQLSFTCAIIKVPLDYAKPAGTMINIAMVRVHDSADTKPLGQLLMNPGGPGASGISLAVGLSPKMPQTVLDHYDLIGFDPRGVGSSTAIRCTSDARKDVLNAASPDVLTPAGLDQAENLAESVSQACSQRYGSALQYYNTVNTARDMDQIRQAVGDSVMNYLGFSYGTELGSVYAHLFPQKVGVMVLDGAVDPLTNDVTSFADQLAGFEGAFDQFAANYCTKTAPCSSLGDPRKAVYAIQAAVMRSPLTVGNRQLTYSLATTGVLSALYSRSDWPSLGNALVEARRGNGSGLLALADQYNERLAGGQYTNLSDANETISCNDTTDDPTPAQVRSIAQQWHKRFPIFGLVSAPGLLSCDGWQPDRTPVPLPTAKTPHTVLVVGNLHDPATPYQGAIALAKTMGNARVLGWDGQGHTSYLEGSSCVDNYVDAYLVHSTLPPANTVCPA